MPESCCASKPPSKRFSFDPILHGSLIMIGMVMIGAFINMPIPGLNILSHTIIEFLSTVWWGVLIGAIFVGLMNKMPKEYFNHILGNGDGIGGIFKATIAGVVFDLCSHGILMVGAKLYERGVSFAQVVAFLIASPWNSISLTVILFALVGIKWTLIFIAGSLVIAVTTGVLIQALTRNGYLPQNPNKTKPNKEFKFWDNAKSDFKSVNFNFRFFISIFTDSKTEVKILVKWLLLGVIIASAIRAYVPLEIFQDWFGPTILGLFLTLIATTIIEVCSEGSAPIASEIVNNANAPGNGFTFLMAGVATDYTEIMVIKDTTKSWKMALILPILTVPQTLLLGYIMNVAG